jgi:SAM-dependent methyltransferase
MLGRKLTPGEVAILETFVIPRYLVHFGDAVLDLMLAGDYARVAHLGCRTGYPDRQIVDMVDGGSVIGVDTSLAAIELARNKAATFHEEGVDYRVAEAFPTDLEEASFSHVLSLHPSATQAQRGELFEEMARLLYPGGQALVALPLRGSFQEIADLVREYALKFDEGDLAKAMDLAIVEVPTIEGLSEELEDAGLTDIDFELRHQVLVFDSGRAFVDDPVTRLLVLPEIQALLGDCDILRLTDYIAQAIDKYWAGRPLEIGVKIGAASARRH